MMYLLMYAITYINKRCENINFKCWSQRCNDVWWSVQISVFYNVVTQRFHVSLTFTKRCNNVIVLAGVFQIIYGGALQHASRMQKF
jgi:hypothetical protein